MLVALYEPEIPQNVGGIIRSCACFDVKLLLIEPLGFVMENKSLKRSQMDYKSDIEKFPSFENFMEKTSSQRKILFTPHTSLSAKDFKFLDGDILVFGRESNGVEDYVAEKMNALVSLPMSDRCRSLNLSVSVVMAITIANY